MLVTRGYMRALYLLVFGPQFGGHSRRIPQCMVSDVQPLVKSSFWETKSSANEFFDFDPSSPPQTRIFFLCKGCSLRPMHFCTLVAFRWKRHITFHAKLGTNTNSVILFVCNTLAWFGLRACGFVLCIRVLVVQQQYQNAT